ncbi:MAG TPA: hypothetical protein VK681_40715 [Reyranella sp.]|nr:hypothetical protein [Reyranella sp.]
MGAVVWPACIRAEAAVPQPLATNLVTATRRHWNGRDCLALELTDDEQAGRLDKTRSGNGPSFAIVHRDFTDGSIEASIGAELTGKGAPDDRGFAGLSFHIGQDYETHETVYLRMTNGRLNAPPPPPPRIDRAVQYVAHPQFHFEVSREAFPGRYEKGADIALGRWHRLRLEVQGARVRALVDGVEVLAVDDLRYAGRRGPVGLFVGDGSRALFADVRINVA